MKQSQLFSKTNKVAPKDEESINAQLLIRGGYVDYSVNVLQWDYFEEFIQNDLLNALALFKEAADLI